MRKILGIQLALFLSLFSVQGASGADMTREDYVNEVNRVSLELKNLTAAKLSLEGGLTNLSLQLDALAAKKANTSDAKAAEFIVTEIKNVEASYLATDAKLNFVKNQITSLTNSLSDLKLKLAAFPTPSISPVPTTSPTLNTAAKLRIIEIDSRVTSLQGSIKSATQNLEITKIKFDELRANLSTATDPQIKASIAANASRTANAILVITSAISNAKAEISSLTAEKAALLATGTKPVATTSPTAKPSAQVKKFGTIRCQKGKEIKKVMGYNPICPKGYVKL
jgi:chromosome segregation ATPase